MEKANILRIARAGYSKYSIRGCLENRKAKRERSYTFCAMHHLKYFATISGQDKVLGIWRFFDQKHFYNHNQQKSDVEPFLSLFIHSIQLNFMLRRRGA
jgi:hypothetical protein